MSNVIPLRTLESTGPQVFHETDTGAPFEQSSPCPVCEGDISKGQRITYLRRGWSHDTCVTNALLETEAGNAWLVLGAQLARRPSHFNATETRAIVEQLLRLAGELPVEMWHPGETAREDIVRRARESWA